MKVKTLKAVAAASLVGFTLAAPPVPEFPSQNSVQVVTNGTTVWPWQQYVSTDVQPPYLQINATGQRVYPGSIFYTPTAGVNAKAFISRLGPIISTDTGDLVWAGPVSGDASNFRVQSLFGQQVISFWEGTGAAAAGLLAGHGYGQVNIYNTSYDQIYTVCPKLNITKPPNQDSDCDLDVHESFITDSGTIIATAYNVTSADLSSVNGTSNGHIFDTLAFEIDIKTGAVLFQWSPLQHIPVNASHYPLAGSGLNTSNPYDPYHVNSIYPFEGGYLINARHTWTTYYVDRTGAIQWQLSGDTGGDFGPIPSGGHFSWQHYAHAYRVSPSQIKYHNFANNNDVAGQTTPSTGVELLLTLPPSPASPPRLLANVSDARQPVAASAEGSHQILPNGDRVLGYGFQPYIKYFGANGSEGQDLRWSARFGYDNGSSSYRAFKQDWHAVPTTLPDLVVRRSGNASAALGRGVRPFYASGLTGYVSWNGATDVSWYNIYAGTGNASLELVGIVEKRGFETSFVLPSSGADSWQVGALYNTSAIAQDTVYEERKSEVVTFS